MVDSVIDANSEQNCSLLHVLVQKMFYFNIFFIMMSFSIWLFLSLYLCSNFLKIKISGAMKLLWFFSNTTFSPCNCMEFIIMASDQILSIPVLLCSRAYVLHMPHLLVVTRWVLLSEDACWGPEDMYHTRVSPPALPVWDWGREGLRLQVFSKPNSYFLKRSIWPFGSSREVISVIWDFLLHLSHGFNIETVPGILMS